MTGYVFCREHGFTTAECALCPSSNTPPDVSARTTVGAAFVESDAIGEQIVRVVKGMLAKVLDEVVAEERARNIAGYVVTEFNVKERT